MELHFFQIQRIVLIFVFVLRQFYCQEDETSKEAYSITYYCNATEFSQFQQLLVNKTALNVTFQWCFESCSSVKEGLFIKATELKTLSLVYEQDCEDVCSRVNLALQNDTFKGLSSLTELNLEGFENTVLDFGVFGHLRNLRTLRLHRFGLKRLNYVDLAKALTAFSGTPLENIKLNSIIGELNSVNDLNIETLFQIKNVSIKKLNFDDNIVPFIDGRASIALPDLQVASFGVQINYALPLTFILDAVTSMQNIEQLRIYSYPPNTKAEIDYSKFVLRNKLPKDIVLKLFAAPDTSCYWNNKMPLSPKLRTLRLNGLRFLDPQIEGGKLCFRDENVLEMLDLTGSPLPSRTPLITGLRNLKVLHAKEMGIRSVSPFQLRQNQMLRVLDVAENNLDEALLEMIFNISDGPNLEILNLSKCDLRQIPTNLVSNLESIVLLDLSQNRLRDADLRLENCINITLVNLSGNDIEYQSSFSTADLTNAAGRNANFTIDLTNNPLSCLCNATAYVKWMQTIGPRHLYGYKDYTCLRPDGTQITVSRANLSEIESACAVLKDVTPNDSCPCDLDVLTQLSHIRAALVNYRCKNTNGKVVQMSSLDPEETNKQCFVIYKSAAFLVPLILGTTIVITLVIIIAVLYKLKKEKRIEHVIPECFNPDRIIGTLMALVYKKREGPREFQYEAFVVYHDNDWSTIRQPILNKLAHQVNITTAEDFEPGAYKMEEIDRCVKDSKWIVLLMSQSFADDGYCKEIVVRAIPRQHAVIPVLLEPLDLRGEELIENLLNTNIPFVWSKESHQQSQIVQNIVDKIRSDHGLTQKDGLTQKESIVN